MVLEQSVSTWLWRALQVQSWGVATIVGNRHPCECHYIWILYQTKALRVKGHNGVANTVKLCQIHYTQASPSLQKPSHTLTLHSPNLQPASIILSNPELASHTSSQMYFELSFSWNFLYHLLICQKISITLWRDGLKGWLPKPQHNLSGWMLLQMCFIIMQTSFFVRQILAAW